ncbi:response regulator [Calothrix sp. 336/3]|uniref:response regulator n=1 Tax=Calothrix sp. 336/3 TaxID=1337936 RepID=UPI0004E2ED13|nr:response regulator [Calothrix sp. 336/3]AKG23997.1 regulator [Calothrix sp. 336/3]
MHQNLQEKTPENILVIDNHEIHQSGTIKVLNSQYPSVKITTAQTVENAWREIACCLPDIIITDIYLPRDGLGNAAVETGLEFLKQLMPRYPQLNIVFYSLHIQKLIYLKSEIDAHQGGFIVTHKNLHAQEVLHRVNWALQGLKYTKDIYYPDTDLTIKPELLQLLNLAFQEGLQDKAIAQHICVSERMVRHYWDQVQSALGIDCAELKNQGKNIRIVTQIRAREVGLID